MGAEQSAFKAPFDVAQTQASTDQTNTQVERLRQLIGEKQDEIDTRDELADSVSNIDMSQPPEAIDKQITAAAAHAGDVDMARSGVQRQVTANTQRTAQSLKNDQLVLSMAKTNPAGAMVLAKNLGSPLKDQPQVFQNPLLAAGLLEATKIYGEDRPKISTFVKTYMTNGGNAEGAMKAAGDPQNKRNWRPAGTGANGNMVLVDPGSGDAADSGVKLAPKGKQPSALDADRRRQITLDLERAENRARQETPKVSDFAGGLTERDADLSRRKTEARDKVFKSWGYSEQEWEADARKQRMRGGVGTEDPGNVQNDVSKIADVPKIDLKTATPEQIRQYRESLLLKKQQLQQGPTAAPAPVAAPAAAPDPALGASSPDDPAGTGSPDDSLGDDGDESDL